MATRRKRCGAWRNRSTLVICPNVRFWPLTHIPYVAFDVAFGGKADMAYWSANVRLWPTAAKRLILQAQGFPILQCFTILFGGRSKAGGSGSFVHEHARI